MITNEIYSYVSSDETLQTLLSGIVGDKKIYPSKAKEGATVPYVIYKSINSGGSVDEILSDETLQFNIIASTYEIATNILKRLSVLLDLQDTKAIASTGAYIYYSKQIGGYDQYEEDTRYHNRMVSFIFKFKMK